MPVSSRSTQATGNFIAYIYLTSSLSGNNRKHVVVQYTYQHLCKILLFARLSESTEPTCSISVTPAKMIQNPEALWLSEQQKVAAQRDKRRTHQFSTFKNELLSTEST